MTSVDIGKAALSDVTTQKEIRVLCRDEAQQVWARKPEFDAANVKLVGLLHEDKDNEIKDFHENFWPGELYLDQQKVFYKELGGGTANKGKAKDLLNPFSQAWKNARKAMGNVKDHNMKGDGLTMGGEMVVAKEGNIVYQHAEKTFGDHAPIDELLTHAKQATSGTTKA